MEFVVLVLEFVDFLLLQLSHVLSKFLPSILELVLVERVLLLDLQRRRGRSERLDLDLDRAGVVLRGLRRGFGRVRNLRVIDKEGKELKVSIGSRSGVEM